MDTSSAAPLYKDEKKKKEKTKWRTTAPSLRDSRQMDRPRAWGIDPDPHAKYIFNRRGEGKKKEKKLTPQALFNFDTSQSALLDHFRTPSPFSLSSQNREFENLITLPGSHARGASALGNAQSIPTISFEYHSCRNDLSSCL